MRAQGKQTLLSCSCYVSSFPEESQIRLSGYMLEFVEITGRSIKQRLRKRPDYLSK